MQQHKKARFPAIIGGGGGDGRTGLVCFPFSLSLSPLQSTTTYLHNLAGSIVVSKLLLDARPSGVVAALVMVLATAYDDVRVVCVDERVVGELRASMMTNSGCSSMNEFTAASTELEMVTSKPACSADERKSLVWESSLTNTIRTLR